MNVSGRATRLIAAAAITAIATLAQQATFEVASVKLAPERKGTAGFTSVESDPAMVRYMNITLKNLIAIAYRYDSNRITDGPSWLDSVLYDVVARIPPDTSKELVPTMLQALLAERFKLKLSRVTAERRAYFLVVGKAGSKLREGREPRGQNQILPGAIMGHSMSMAAFAGLLSRFMGYPVIDKTGLSGTYDIDMRWTPVEATDQSEILAAIQDQLGLKLESGRAPVETLKIDSAEQVPSGN